MEFSLVYMLPVISMEIKVSERGLRRGTEEGWYRPNTNGGKCHCGCGLDAPIATMTKRRTGAVQGLPQRYLSGHNLSEIERPQGEDHWGFGHHSGAWRGGRGNDRGYVLRWIPASHSFACMRSKAGYIREHRLVMAEFLGRPLMRDEIVHHINNRRDDNRIENLELISQAANRKYARERAVLAECILKAIEAQGIPGEEWLGGVCGI